MCHSGWSSISGWSLSEPLTAGFRHKTSALVWRLVGASRLRDPFHRKVPSKVSILQENECNNSNITGAAS